MQLLPSGSKEGEENMAKRRKKKKQVLKVPKELISASEFARRKRVWQQHYDKAQESDAYKLLMKQRQALKEGDMVKFRKLAQEAKEAVENGKVNSQPPFPDPNLEKLYGKLGIKEHWDKKIKEAEEKGIGIKTTG